MQYTSDEVIVPFWAEFSNVAGGRDPLAIQNSSVVVYSKMIVGITNLTNRIRYHGFYCWIFDKIALNIKKSNSLSEQIKFYRRAELLLAYVMVHNFPNETGVSGSDYARRNIDSLINLEKGADWKPKKEEDQVLYWKLKTGIFGQYYSGVVKELNLINPTVLEENLFINTLTEKGKSLCRHFSKNIPSNEQELFWHSVYNGKIYKEDLLKLSSFNLAKIPANTEEQIFYQDLILAQDDSKEIATYNRRDSIQLLLNYILNHDTLDGNLTESFLMENYKENITRKDLPFNTSTSWYLYEMNELLHVCYEYFHTCFLNNMDTTPSSLDGCINALVNNVVKSFKKDGIEGKANLEHLLIIVEEEETDVYDNFLDMKVEFHKNGDFGECLKLAIKVFCKVYLNSKKHLKQLDEFSTLPENNFNRTGYAIGLLNDLIVSKVHFSLKEYIRAIIIDAINLHTFSSYGKSKIGQGLVHNYMIEENKVWRLRHTLPRRTTPRIQNLLQTSIDLGWVIKTESKEYHVTTSGKKIITH